MRYPSEHKVESRARIVAAAARQIRAKGPHGVAVSDVMASAGLTHGAFYAHFESKDALVAEAVASMFAEMKERRGGLDTVLESDDKDLAPAFRAYLENYLSPRHRDGPERGCPLPALSADIARSGGPARENLARGMQRMTRGIAAVLQRLGLPGPEARAHAVVARMVGAVALARAAGTGPESDAILRDCRDALFAELAL